VLSSKAYLCGAQNAKKPLNGICLLVLGFRFLPELFAAFLHPAFKLFIIISAQPQAEKLRREWRDRQMTKTLTTLQFCQSFMISFSSQDAGHVVPRNQTDIRPTAGQGKESCQCKNRHHNG